jgi:hypothetical protein
MEILRSMDHTSANPGRKREETTKQCQVSSEIPIFVKIGHRTLALPNLIRELSPKAAIRGRVVDVVIGQTTVSAQLIKRQTIEKIVDRKR